MKYQIINGNNINVLKTFPDDHFDSIVTDPPYGIDFLGKSWDANTGALETYQQCLRVLKPGGHILAFSAPRTYHHLAVTLEQAGFEIRDQIMWIQSNGFPKSQDIGKSIERSNKKKNTEIDSSEWNGWGTALKPAHEPIALARKPIKLSIKDNVLKYRTGALNIDACRIDSETLTYPANGMNRVTFNQSTPDKWEGDSVTNDQGRFPANVIGEIPEYQKYFYCPKVGRRERHAGFELPPAMFGDVQGAYDENGERFAVGFDDRAEGKVKKKYDPLGHIPTDSGGMLNSDTGLGHYTGSKQNSPGNNHPTVKPIELMKYLIKLITPKGGRVLDPFNGSGSTGCAAVELGHEYVGIELDPKYVEIATKRIEAWNKEDTAFKELFTECR